MSRLSDHSEYQNWVNDQLDPTVRNWRTGEAEYNQELRRRQELVNEFWRRANAFVITPEKEKTYDTE